MKQTLSETQQQEEKRVDADVRCRQWLARATDAKLAGRAATAEKYERKAQYWLDRLNKLEGRG